jgi:hypothetical protein
MDIIGKFTGPQPTNEPQETQTVPQPASNEVSSAGITQTPDAIANDFSSFDALTDGAEKAVLQGLAEGPAASDIQDGITDIGSAISDRALLTADTKVEIHEPTESEVETTRRFSEARAKFENDLFQMAQRPGEFEAYLTKFYGDNYNTEAGEKLRQQILAHDFSWLPKMEYVSRETLQGHGNAVDPSTIYIDHELIGPGPLLSPSGTPYPSGWVSKEGLAHDVHEQGVWTALRSQLDPQDANNVAGREFATIYVNGKPTIVEFPPPPPMTNIW